MNFIHFQAFSENPNLDFPYPWTSLISAEIFWDARPLFMTFLGAAIITFAYGAIGDARCSRSLQELMPLVWLMMAVWSPGMHNFRDDFDTYCDTNIMAPSSESASGKDWWRKNFQEHRHCSSDLIYTWFILIHDSWLNDGPAQSEVCTSSILYMGTRAGIVGFETQLPVIQSQNSRT